jgi:hypothetical protein
MKMFSKKKGFNEFGEKLVDPSNTPISKYKNRRQMIINEKRKSLQSTFDEGGHSGSFIGKQIHKLINKDTSVTNSTVGDNQETGWINEISFTKNEQ